VKVSVLIGDDHTVVRDGLRALLETNPEVQVVGGAASGRQTVSQFLRLRPEIVILDISMPDLNGIEAAQQILEASPQTGVIMLSMIGTPEHLYQALRAGARGYLLKESAGQEVMEAVLTVHGGMVYLSQPVLNILISDYLQHRGQEEEREPLRLLSEREREVLEWVVEGKTSAEIAEILFLSPKTVESYRSRMMRKLDIPDLPSLMRFAMEEGLIT
jgi:DNA-binding NarL/FixJ family response regulator